MPEGLDKIVRMLTSLSGSYSRLLTRKPETLTAMEYTFLLRNNGEKNLVIYCRTFEMPWH